MYVTSFALLCHRDLELSFDIVRDFQERGLRGKKRRERDRERRERKIGREKE